MEKKTKNVLGCLGLVVIGFVLMLFLGWILGGDPENSDHSYLEEVGLAFIVLIILVATGIVSVKD